MKKRKMLVNNAIKFSVSMCVYKNDNPIYFKEAVESIINQTVKPDEVVIVVDGPITHSINKVLNYYEALPFFKIVRLDENVGHGKARQKGLEECTNNLIALMDADDISLAHRFESQLKCFQEDDNLSIVGGNIQEFINNVNNVVGIREVPQRNIDIGEYLKKRSPMNQVTVMLKKDAVLSAGGYKDWYNNEDYYLWIRMYQIKLKFKNISDVLVYVRVGSDMYSRRGGWEYFKSEAYLQKYLFDQNLINYIQYLKNILIRFLVQVLLPNNLRGFLFKKFARKKLPANSK